VSSATSSSNDPRVSSSGWAEEAQRGSSSCRRVGAREKTRGGARVFTFQELVPGRADRGVSPLDIRAEAADQRAEKTTERGLKLTFAPSSRGTRRSLSLLFFSFFFFSSDRRRKPESADGPRPRIIANGGPKKITGRRFFRAKTHRGGASRGRAGSGPNSLAWDAGRLVLSECPASLSAFRPPPRWRNPRWNRDAAPDPRRGGCVRPIRTARAGEARKEHANPGSSARPF